MGSAYNLFGQMRKINIILLLTILGLIIALCYTCDHAKRVEQKVQEEQKEVSIWRDKYNHSNAEVEVRDIAHINKVDSLQHQLNIKPKSVTKIIKVSNIINDTIVVTKDRPFGDRWARFNFVDSKSAGV